MAKPAKKQTELVWANEIMEVFRNLGTDVVDCKWSTNSAKYLWTWTREDAKNEDKFLTAMVPKATDILAKHGLVDAADAVLEIDAKTIRDLKLLLVGSVSEAQEMVISGDMTGKPVMETVEPQPGLMPGVKPLSVEICPEQADIDEILGGNLDDTQLEPDLSIEDLF